MVTAVPAMPAAPAASAAPRAVARLAVGQPIPPLNVRSYAGESLDIIALHGKAVVLNFWASW